MKKYLLFLAAFLICLQQNFAAQAETAFPKAEAPVFITSFGQSQDANFVNLLSKRVKLEVAYRVYGQPEGDEWTKAKTLIAVLGGSSKGLGVAGLDVPTEKKRCDDIIALAREQKKYIIGMHIGGEDRRGPTSEAFIPYAGSVDFMIVRSDGNKDGYFTKLCEEKGIPLHIIENTKEIEGILKEIFGM
jgi:hypothetical protein